jgi:dTDP-4-dehydrorhamnose reductase
MKIAIVGAAGFIGNHLYTSFKEKKIEVLGTFHVTPRADCVHFDLISDDFSIFHDCSHVFIGAAITRIDDCFKNQDSSFALNVTRTIALTQYLFDHSIVPVFFSTDQVFDGQTGNYREDDEVRPLNVYGAQKVIVEQYMKKSTQPYLVFRLGKVYVRGLFEPSMFSEITTKLSKGQPVRAATDKIFNPTEIDFVCRVALLSIEKSLSGLFHVAQPLALSSYDFALSIAQEYGYAKELIEPVTFSEYKTLEKRALNSSLNVDKLFKALDL